MIRKQLYIDKELDEALKELASRSGRSEAAHVRAALRAYLGRDATAPRDGDDPMLALIGLVDDEGPDDVAVHHDHYLYGVSKSA